MKISCFLIPAKDFPCERKGRNLLKLKEIPGQARDEGMVLHLHWQNANWHSPVQKNAGVNPAL